MRQEVSILSQLHHDNLAKLCGVRITSIIPGTTPMICLLLELASKSSLRDVLKKYKAAKMLLEPLTLKTTICQVWWIFISSLLILIHLYIYNKHLSSNSLNCLANHIIIGLELQALFEITYHKLYCQSFIIKVSSYRSQQLVSVCFYCSLFPIPVEYSWKYLNETWQADSWL